MDDERAIVWKEFGKTLLNPWALSGSLLAGLLILILPRRYVLIPFIAVCCLLPTDQRLVVAGADFNMVRLLLLFGWVRVLIRGEAKAFEWQRIDSCFALLMLVSSVSHVIREASVGELIWRIGATFEAAGTYFLVRCLVSSIPDLRNVATGFAVLVLPFAFFMTIEHHTGHNLFAVFDGVPELTMIRDGKLRCQGAFPHPILAGDLGAGVLPLALGLAFTSSAIRPLAIVAVLASAVVVWFSASSGPLLAAIGAMAAWALWSLRWKMYLVRRAIVALLFMFQLTMNHPIWFLFAIVGPIGGSTGWFRYMLFDAFVKNAPDWFLVGVSSTAHWGWGLQDITNHFVLEGVRGGFLGFVCFIAMFVYAFKAIGISMRSVRYVARRERRAPGRGVLHLLWGFGASLVAHLLAMTGVSYFDQLLILFYLTLAAIASAQQVCVRAARAGARESRATPTAAPAEARPAQAGVRSIFGARRIR